MTTDMVVQRPIAGVNPSLTANPAPLVAAKPAPTSAPVATQPIAQPPAAPAQPVVVAPAAPAPAHTLALTMNLDQVAAAPHRHIKYLVKPRRTAQLALMGMATLLFVGGGYAGISGLHANHQVAKTVTQLTQQANAAASGGTSTGIPSTTKPSAQAIASYQVAADMPRYIRIPSLDTQARVLSLGVKTDGSVATPNNVYDAAWFNQSAKPGTAGGSFIVGHVSSWTSNGVFYNLRKATPGMLIEIEKGDGTKLEYKVVKTQIYDADHVDMNQAVNSVTPGTQGLNIMTCTGKVIPGTSEFDNRLLVMAVRVS